MRDNGLLTDCETNGSHLPWEVGPSSYSCGRKSCGPDSCDVRTSKCLSFPTKNCDGVALSQTDGIKNGVDKLPRVLQERTVTDVTSGGARRGFEGFLEGEASKHELRQYKTLCKIANQLTIQRLMQNTFRGKIIRHIWTDAAVKQQEGAAGAFGIIPQRRRGLKSCYWHNVWCGHTCSYRAEGLVIEAALRACVELVRRRARRGKKKGVFILFTDSQSFLNSLQKFPLALKTTQRLEDNCWILLHQLTREGIRVHMQYVHSHCGTELNERADEAAKHALENFLQHALPVLPRWVTDVKARVSLLFRRRREQLLDPTTHRTSILGTMPTKLTIDEQRSTSLRLCRLRTGESLEVGITRRRLHLDKTMACRWCTPLESQHNPIHNAMDQPRQGKVISNNVTNAAKYWLPSHYATQHAEHALPAKWQSRAAGPKRTAPKRPGAAALRVCKYCHVEGKSEAHERLCPMKPRRIMVERPRPVELEPIVSTGIERTETLQHLVNDCPSLCGPQQGILQRQQLSAKLLKDERLLTFMDKAREKYLQRLTKAGEIPL